MNIFRIALANLPYAATPEESVTLAEQAIAEASAACAGLICFPECFVPCYRGLSKSPPGPDPAFLQRAHHRIAEAAKRERVAVILGTERIVEGRLLITVLVVDRDGTALGFQDKVQLDPSEEDTYSPGSDRCVFRSGELTFGVAICHEGFRYPETVRWAARRGAQVVFHPHYHPDGPVDTFHEKAALCRAAENTIYYATVNYASVGSATTSAVVRPDGTLQCAQPYGLAGLLVADIDLASATGLLAKRLKTC